MIEIPGFRVLAELYQGTRNTIFRGIRTQDDIPVILKCFTASSPSFHELGLFHYSFELTKDLAYEGICRSYELLENNQRPVLVMEDIGGISLQDYLEKKPHVALEDIVSMAIQITKAVAHLHDASILHKDINPSNVIIVPETRQLQIIDFDLCSKLTRERVEAWDPARLQGTLAYISPEQTGRINRTIDHRTDLYSLGATLYTILTGQLLFPGKDVLSLIHSHIAEAPVPPHEIDREIPLSLSQIVLKLLEKTPEDRYQSASGLRADLEHFQARMLEAQEDSQIDLYDESFPLATRDRSPHLQISQRLFGREWEREQLLKAYQAVGEGEIRFFLVAGYSGIGKTSLVREIHKPITETRGRFVAGKHSLFQNTPHAGLIQALQQLIESILTETEAQIDYWRERILKSLGNIAQVIVDVIPELELIIGPQPPVIELPSAETQNRFQLAFQRFIQVFARKEHPLTIFIDDLQWAKSISIDLIARLLADPQSSYLFIIGAYRDNEVKESHPLYGVLQELKDQQKGVMEIKLAPLRKSSVAELIAETLDTPTKDIVPLVDIVYNKTHGNPFFIDRFLKAIHEEGALKMEDYDWRWDLDAIQEMGITENVADLMSRKLHNLAQEVKDVVQSAACIGDRFDLWTLSKVCKLSPKHTGDLLWPAVREELLLPIGTNYRFIGLLGEEDEAFDEETLVHVEYRFAHDRIQQAAYELLPSPKRTETHLQIGRILRDNPRGASEHIFELSNQLNLGRELLTDPQELLGLARLNLQAGEKAMDAIAYQSAFDYLNAGVSVLPKDAWIEHRDLAYALYHTQLNAAHMNGEAEQFEALLQELLRQDLSKVERAKITQIWLRRLTNEGEQQKGIKIGFDELSHYGREYPSSPEGWGALVAEEGAALARLMEGREISELLHAPEITDQDVLLEMSLLFDLTPVAGVDPTIFTYIMMRLPRLSIEHGTGPDSASGYVFYASLLCMMGDYATGDAFGKLAIALHDKYGLPARLASTLQTYGGWVCHWSHPLDEAIKYTERAVQIGLETGGTDWSGWGLMNLGWQQLARGIPLPAFYDKLDRYIDLAKDTLKYDDAYHDLLVTRHVVLRLMGRQQEIQTLESQGHSEQELLETLEHYGMAKGALHTQQAQAAVLLGNYREAVEKAELAAKFVPLAPGMVGASELCFYHSLALLALYPQAEAAVRESSLQTVEENLAKLRGWAALAPMNQSYKVTLLEAELAAFRGAEREASELFDKAILEAESNGFIHGEAIALERAAQFYNRNHRHRIAQGYLTDARYAYVRWGARAKVHALEAQSPALRPQQMWGSSIISGSTAAGSSTQSTEYLDMQTILKANQAISEEIVLSDLLRKLMDTAIENAGAQRGALLLNNQGCLSIEALVESKQSAPLILQGLSLEDGHISASVVRFVERVREKLVLGHAKKNSRFAQDPYIIQQDVKSLLCMPILHKNEMIGILYLENNLAPSVFVAERIAILDVLSAQAAISIENARLYNSVNERVEERTAELQEAMQKIQNAQTQLVQSEKMASLGTLVAGVAHEINNPANFTRTGSQNLMRRLEDLQEFLLELAGDDNEEAQELFAKKFEPIFNNLKAILDGTERIKSIVRNLRIFSRLDEFEQKEADIIDGLNSTLSLIKANYHEQVVFTTDFGQDESIYLDCWPAQLNQVFMNLMVNACQAIVDLHGQQEGEEAKEPTGRLAIRTERVEGWVHVIFEDNGSGMSPEVQKRIFEPFYTTRGVGQGTGLGLSISYGIIEKHKGEIRVESEQGLGTTFTIRLPLHAEPQS